MHIDLINISLAFIEGFALIISPCILPILPFILSGSLTGSKSRPLGIISGFVATFAIVTLFSRAIVSSTHISSDAIRYVSFAILLLLGIIMMSTYLTEKFNLLTQRLANVGSTFSSVNQPESGFWGGVFFGALVSVIWTPCAGPILAAVIVQAVLQQTSVGSILIVVAFAIGAGLPMLLIALLGRKMMSRFYFFREKTGLIRKILGAIIIASVIFLIYNPTGAFISAPSSPQSFSMSLRKGLSQPYPAPPLSNIQDWINTSPLQISDLKGKVVLIDFWTYSCINCIHTLPYLKDWYAKYHDKGLVIIGVHSPEFEFEKNLDNVKRAVAQFGILYPVALDSQFGTWQNYHNQYWPAHYLIDKEGNVVYEYFGEGEYDTTENNIRYLLGLSPAEKTNASRAMNSFYQTPETYFGYARSKRFASPDAVVKDKPVVYHFPATLSQNEWALKGEWIVYRDKIVAVAPGAAIRLHFHAGKVYAVMGAPVSPVAIRLALNGKPLTEQPMMVKENQLYTLLSTDKDSDGTLELKADKAGLEMYTFTFDN